MPKKTLRELSARAVAQGLDPSMPAVAIANATRPDETIVAGTIGNIAQRIEDRAPEGPVLVMIGRVLAEVVEADVGRNSDPSAEASAKAEAYSAVAS